MIQSHLSLLASFKSVLLPDCFSAMSSIILKFLFLDLQWLVLVVDVKPSLLSGEYERFLLKDIVRVLLCLVSPMLKVVSFGNVFTYILGFISRSL